jgi:hypothetical protein
VDSYRGVSEIKCRLILLVYVLDLEVEGLERRDFREAFV